MDKWMIFGGTALYMLCAVGMLEFLHQARYTSRALRVMAAFFWPVTLTGMGVSVILEAIISTWKDKRYCDHEFFRCQVPASDSCVAIYHQVCRKCRWDKNKGIFMPLDIWRGWAVPQLEKLDAP